MQPKILSILAGCLISIGLSGAAKAEIRPLTASCLIDAVKRHGLYLGPMMGLIATEGGHPGTESVNKNGSHDLGVMQINDRTWLRDIAKKGYGGNLRAARISLRDDGCANVWYAAGIFARYVNEANGDYTKAVGFYNSHTYGPMKAYQRVFMAHYLTVMKQLEQKGMMRRVISDISYGGSGRQNYPTKQENRPSLLERQIYNDTSGPASAAIEQSAGREDELSRLKAAMTFGD